MEIGKRKLEKHTEREGTENAEERLTSDEEIEDEEKETENKKDGRAVNSAAREACYGVKKRNGNGFEAGFLTDRVEGPSRRVAGEIAAEKGKLILEPHEEIAAAAPHKRRTSHE